MSQDRYAEDPVAYRVDYSRIAQSLHLESVRDQTRDKEHARRGRKVKEPSSEVAELVKRLIGPQPPERSAEEVMREALMLIDRARAELLDLGWKWVGWTPRRYRHPFRRREKRRLAEFLAQILEPATVVLYFSARIENSEGLDVPDAGPPSLLRRKPPARKGGNEASADEDDARWACLYLQYLLSSKDPEARPYRRYLLSSKGPEDQSPWWIVWKRSDDVNFRVRYNLACMFSRLGAPRGLHGSSRGRAEGDHEADMSALERSVEQLRQAIASAKGRDRQALVDWAERDPALTAVRAELKGLFLEALSAAAAADDLT